MAIRVGATGSPGSAAEYYPFTDNLGNVRAMVTATGTTPSVAYTYSAYGVATSTTGSLVQPYLNGNGYTDTATGLSKLSVRYYDPVNGRFTQHDPTGQEQHPYLYSSAGPDSLSDPSGSINVDLGSAIGAAALGLVGAAVGASACVATAGLCVLVYVAAYSALAGTLGAYAGGASDKEALTQGALAGGSVLATGLTGRFIKLGLLARAKK